MRCYCCEVENDIRMRKFSFARLGSDDRNPAEKIVYESNSHAQETTFFPRSNNYRNRLIFVCE